MWWNKMTDEWKYINLFHRRFTTPFVWSPQAKAKTKKKSHLFLSAFQLMCACVYFENECFCLLTYWNDEFIFMRPMIITTNVHLNNSQTLILKWLFSVIWNILLFYKDSSEHLFMRQHTGIHISLSYVSCVNVYTLLRRFINWIELKRTNLYTTTVSINIKCTSIKLARIHA